MIDEDGIGINGAAVELVNAALSAATGNDGTWRIPVPIGTYDDSLTITLKLYVPAYHLNPPHPCYNRFHMELLLFLRQERNTDYEVEFLREMTVVTKYRSDTFGLSGGYTP